MESKQIQIAGEAIVTSDGGRGGKYISVFILHHLKKNQWTQGQESKSLCERIARNMSFFHKYKTKWRKVRSKDFKREKLTIIENQFELPLRFIVGIRNLQLKGYKNSGRSIGVVSPAVPTSISYFMLILDTSFGKQKIYYLEMLKTRRYQAQQSFGMEWLTKCEQGQ